MKKAVAVTSLALALGVTTLPALAQTYYYSNYEQCGYNTYYVCGPYGCNCSALGPGYTYFPYLPFLIGAYGWGPWIGNYYNDWHNYHGHWTNGGWAWGGHPNDWHGGGFHGGGFHGGGFHGGGFHGGGFHDGGFHDGGFHDGGFHGGGFHGGGFHGGGYPMPHFGGGGFHGGGFHGGGFHGGGHR